ncbi:MAG TPA: hypothetical protein VIF82_08530 [Burkholderiaceae bacterium]|jgi:hypothetical protein
MRERPISFVPGSALFLLLLGLVLQIGWHLSMSAPQAKAEDLAAPPSLLSLDIASFGEQIALSKILMLYVQSFDSQSGVDIPYRKLNYEHLQGWLTRVLELDPSAQYPLFAASRIYAEVGDEAKQRSMLNFIYQQFLIDPNRRWPWLAHASVIAKHRLKDLPLARSYAQAIRLNATGKDVPNWAKQMEIFILQDMNELESAKVLIGGLLNSGQINDPNEIRFLQEKLNALERHSKSKS